MSNAVTHTTIQATNTLTDEQFKAALPDHLRKTVNQSLIDQINLVLADPDHFEEYRDNLLSYTSVLSTGKFKMLNYVSAVKYVSHKLRGSTNIEAYVKTFPDKYQDFLTRGVSSSDIASYITAYNKSILVNKIYEQTLIPTHILNADLFQKAINVQAELMLTAKSEKVRSDAANSLMTQLRPPEVKKVELDIGLKQDNSIQQLRDATSKLAQAQQQAAKDGVMSAKDIADSKIVIDVVAKEV